MSDQNNVKSTQSSTGAPVVLTCAARGCHATVPANRRKYCDDHGQQASILWKRAFRIAERARYKIARGLDPATPATYLKGWSSREVYNARCKAGMRAVRARRKAARDAAVLGNEEAA